MTYVLVIALMAVVSLAYVAAPLRRARDEGADVDPVSDLEDAKTVALTAILDLENERDMGKLSEEDFAELRAMYETQAIAALRAIDEEIRNESADRLEIEIARLRQRLSAPACSACGAPLPADADVCARCGA